MNHDPHLIGAAVLAAIVTLFVAFVAFILIVIFDYNRSKQRRK